LENQNYANHKRLDPKYHFIFTFLTLVMVVGSIVNLVIAFKDAENQFVSVLLFVIALMFAIIVVIIRTYPLKAQDRGIQAEEGLRHFILTGKRMNTNLTRSQIIALRFASDAEFPALCEKAADEKLSSDAIKKAIGAWRADHFRI
jgi:uncharacterized protein YhhL (DUF1145 family)